MRTLFCTVIALAIACMRVHGQADVDTAVAHAIKAEATERGRVMEWAFHLSEVIGNRLTGTSGFKRAGEWAGGRLRDFGLHNVHTEPIPWGRGWSEQRFSVRLVEPAHAELMAISVPFSRPTEGRVSGQAILVALPRPGDGAEVYDGFFNQHRGKLRHRIILAHAPLPPGPPARGRQSEEELQKAATAAPDKAADAAFEKFSRDYRYFISRQRDIDAFLVEQGALAVLYQSRNSAGTVRLGGGPLTARTQDAYRREPGYPLPPASAILAWEHYNRISRLISRGVDARIEIELQASLQDDPTAAFNLLADIPGATSPEEVVLIGAHLDAWPSGTGAADNAAGSAVVMEAMRILATLKVRPSRTIRAAMWGGHEGAGLGAKAYVRQHLVSNYPLADTDQRDGDWKLLPDHKTLSVYFNHDHGQGPIRGMHLEGHEELRSLFGTWFNAFPEFAPFYMSSTDTGGTDNEAFNAVGSLGLQFWQQYDFSVWTHHSNVDLFDHIKEQDLERNAALLAFFAYQAATHPRLLTHVAAAQR